MNDQAAHGFYADPANLVPAGPGRRRKRPLLTSMASVRFAPEVIAQVKGLASAEGVTVGAWIRRAVRQAVERAQRARPEGLIPGSGRAGRPVGFTSVTAQLAPAGTVFRCAHMSASGVTSLSCWQCGPLAPAA